MTNREKGGEMIKHSLFHGDISRAVRFGSWFGKLTHNLSFDIIMKWWNGWLVPPQYPDPIIVDP